MHWVMTVDRRATGWLDELFHARWREMMLHALVRYDIVCPVYCLMPDHVHMIWMGCSERADLKLASTFFRRATNPLLAPRQWQREGFDHVLREDERQHDALKAVGYYVLENPVRKNLVDGWTGYRFSGLVIPGFPDLDPRREDFWAVFWAIYNRKVETAGTAP